MKQQHSSPFATAKVAALENDYNSLPEIKTLAIEEAALAQALANNPSRPDATALQTRKSVVHSAINSLHAGE